MTEKEKMIRGDLYLPSDNELIEDRKKARELTYEFNQLPIKEKDKRKKVLQRLLGGYKENFEINPLFNVDYGYNIFIGENFYSNYNCTMLDVSTIHIGDNCMFGPNVGLYTETHPIDPGERDKGLECANPIVMSDDVWCGGSFVVKPGVSSGDNVIIDSGAVVMKDVPTSKVVRGNPAKIIKSINGLLSYLP